MQNYTVDTIALRKLMIEQGYMTISSLSKASDVSRNTLSKVLDGSIRPSADVMSKLAVALTMSPEVAGRVFLPETYAVRKFRDRQWRYAKWQRTSR